MFVLGTLSLHPEKQLLMVGDRAVALQRKPLQVLLCLIENRHRMVTREELLDQFWEGKEVYDQSLSKAIGSIRKAFGEPAGSEYIETRWGLGYRYVGPFLEVPDQPAEASVVVSAPKEESLETSQGTSAPLTAPAWKRRWIAGVAAALLLILGGLAMLLIRRHVAADKAALATAAPGIRSVAVLPFTANSDREEDRYLGLGLADAVAARLDTVPKLRVRSSNTVGSILGPHPDLGVAGRKLAVEGLVQGDIQRVNDRMVITVRLLDARDGKDIWSGQFKGDESDIFATEDFIAQQVSSALLPHMGSTGLKLSSEPDTRHPEAYGKYMKAEFFASMRTPGSMAKAIDLLNEVIRIDPKYARAYAALADCYGLEGFYHFVPPTEAYPKAKEAALKALAMDNSLAEAHVSLLSTLTDYDWDWEGAEREFRAAIAIDPNYAVAYQYFGYALLGAGRGAEGLLAMKHAAELDPVSPSVLTSLAWAYYLLRQDDRAVEQCQRVLELYPDFVVAHQVLGVVYGQMGLGPRALAELNQAKALEGDSAITPMLLAYERAKSGQRAGVVRSLKEMEARGASVPDYYLALAWTAAGEKQKAQAALERAYDARSNWMIYLQYDPRLDTLRRNAPFQALVQEVASPRKRTRPRPATENVAQVEKR